MATKRFRLRADQIRDVARGHGACIASDRITVDGAKVGWMYRGPKDRDGDSGWRFFAGDEDEDYAGDASKHDVYDVNTIANYDPEVVPWLASPVGSAFERRGGRLRPAEWEMPEEERDPDLNPEFPVVEGRLLLTDHWVVDVPVRLNARDEEAERVLWRPGLTFWLRAWDAVPGETGRELVERIDRAVELTRTDVEEVQTGPVYRRAFRLDEGSEDGRRPGLHALVGGLGAVLQVAAYFDEERDAALAWTLVRSIRPA